MTTSRDSDKISSDKGVLSVASEYLKWKYKDVKPDEQVTYTKKEKAANWWYYNKWYVIGGIILLIIVANIGYYMLGFGRINADYYIAYVGTEYLPKQTISTLESALASLAPDSNGDGKVIVKLNQYVELGDDLAYTYSSTAALLADFERGESCFFLLEDPETFQEKYSILLALDDSDTCYLSWKSCPMLTSLELGEYQDVVLGEKVSGSNQELLSKLYFARRGFWAENAPSNAEDYDTLWDTLTK